MYKNGRSYSPSSVIDAIDRTSPPRNGEFQRSFSRSTDSLDSLPTFGSPALDFTHSSVRAPTVQQQQQQQPPHGPGKCRLLPCRTFISTGSCCYGDRCVFLHDQSIVSKPVFVKYLKKSKEDNTPDAFFWPMMPSQLVKNKLDNKNQPDINQAYLIPAPYMHANANLSSNMNHFAVFSMWEHFVDFLASDSLSVVAQPRPVPPLNPRQQINRYTGRRRLQVFSQLSSGLSIAVEEKKLASFDASMYSHHISGDEDEVDTLLHFATSSSLLCLQEA